MCAFPNPLQSAHCTPLHKPYSSNITAALTLAVLPPCQAFAGIVTVSGGHCHPTVAAAMAEQNRLLQHTTTIYLHHQIAQYAKELTDRLPGNLKVSPQRYDACLLLQHHS